MEQQKVFASALFGFEKKTVLDYIYEQDMLFKKKEADWEQRLAEYEEKLGTLEQETPDVEQYQEQLDVLTASYNEEKETVISLQERYSQLGDEVEQLVQVAKNKERELQLQQEVNSQLRSKCETLEEKLKVLAKHVLAERELMASLPDPSVIPKVEHPTLAEPPVFASEPLVFVAEPPVFVAEAVEAVAVQESTNAFATVEDAPAPETVCAPQKDESALPDAYIDLKTELTEFRQAVSKTLLNFEAALARLESGKTDPAQTGENHAFFR